MPISDIPDLSDAADEAALQPGAPAPLAQRLRAKALLNRMM
jgi:hypothetical protein